MLQSVLAHRPQAVKVAAAPLAKHPLALLRNTAEVLCPEHARAAEVNRWPTLSALRIGPTYMGLQLTHVCPERLEVLLQLGTAQLREFRCLIQNTVKSHSATPLSFSSEMLPSCWSQPTRPVGSQPECTMSGGRHAPRGRSRKDVCVASTHRSSPLPRKSHSACRQNRGR